jgi:hypothetical protein
LIKSKVAVEEYDVSYQDIVKILNLGPHQAVTDLVVSGGGKGAAKPWGMKFVVETRESTSIEIPAHKEK